METKLLILSAIFTTCLVSCEKKMVWLNPDDPEADLSKINAVCEEKHAECGYIEQEFDGKMRKIFCGECTQEGYECKTYNRCGDIDECANHTQNNCPENADCHNLDMKSEGKPFECVCKKNYSGDDCTPDTRTKECEDLPENAEWNSVSEITQTWNGEEWEPSNQGTFNEEASETECRFKCKEDYFWNDSKCLSDTRTFKCSGLPENAEWNSVSEYTQKWDGTNWLPEDSESEYNKEASETACRFKCIENYEWNGTECLAETRKTDCDPKPENSVWNDNGANGTLSQTWNGNEWTPSSKSTFNKTAGECVFKCATGFYWNNDTCEVAPTRDYGCTDLPANAEWNTTETITQTWDGEIWKPTNIGTYNETASPGECRFKCKENYNWVESTLSCNAAQQTAECTELPENAQWNTAETITQTWNGEKWLPTTTGSYNETLSLSECRFKCKIDYHWENLACVSNTKNNVACTGLPSNAQWNTVSTISQNWNGSEWLPTTTSSFNNSASTSECRFKCKNNYTWTDNTTCKANQKVSNCTGLPKNAVWNTAETISQIWNGSSWTPTTTGTYNETASTTQCRFKCAPNYTWNGTNCTIPQCSSTSSTPCKDYQSGLIWSAKVSRKYWIDAGTYCENLTEGDYLDWRLPNIDELKTLLIADRVKNNCRVSDATGCLSLSNCWSCSTCTETGSERIESVGCESYGTSYDDGRYSKFGDTGRFWSSSLLSDKDAWHVNFDYGYVDYFYTTSAAYFRCVR